jgi:hypothetical protein
MSTAPLGTAHISITQNRSFLLLAFWLQALLVVICIGTSVFLYRDYKQNLSIELQRQAELSRQLAEQQKELDATSQSLKASELVQIQTAIRAKTYADAVSYAHNALQEFPNEPSFEWLLIKAYLLTGNKQAALKEANALAVSAGGVQVTSSDIQRNLLSRGIAKCANGDVIGSVADLKQSGIAKWNWEDVQSFCPTVTRSEVGL